MRNENDLKRVEGSAAEKCGTCGHSRAHHIAIDGPCNVHRGSEFCACDHFAKPRPVVAEP